ncbi:MAG TPA: extracellular solute-binding protein [Arachnia sp.]|nr:extracellular solute-binding protein [Arachnia sp.]
MFRVSKKLGAALATAAVATLALAACSAPAESEDGPVELTYFTWSDATAVAQAEALVEAFTAENPDITVTLDANPGGAEGDNLVKTRLSTGEMSDVMAYNSGSLLQALNPEATLVDLSDEPWMADVDEDFRTSVSAGEGVYGAPTGTAQAGGVIYSKKIYDELGLTVPATWDEFMANNQVIADAGIVPFYQAYGDGWTSQLTVLGSFANVTSADPDWATEYTAGQRRYAEEPAFQSFQHLQDVAEAGFFNENFPSATNDDAMAALVDGTAAHYPMLTSVALSNLRQNFPDAMQDMGVFPVPADDAADTALTIWEPNAIYIPKTTEGAKLEAAKKFVAFFNSEKGCELQNETEPGGPYVISTCTLPDDVAPMVTDVQQWVEDGKSGLALEFISPIKGPNLEGILVEVGSKITTAEEGAAAYDEDVKKQAQQLGLEGW